MSQKRQCLSIQQKIELLDKYATGLYNQAELGQCAMETFQVSKPLSQHTISGIIKDSEKIYNNVNVKVDKKSLKRPMYPQLDQDIAKFVTELNAANRPVDRPRILQYVKYLAKSKYKIPEDALKFSYDWLIQVFKRTKLKSRYTYGECASVDISSGNIQNETGKTVG